MRIRVEVDHGRCMGTAACIYLAPDKFSLDAEGKSVPVQQIVADGKEIQEAAEGCPVEAIRLFYENRD